MGYVRTTKQSSAKSRVFTIYGLVCPVTKRIKYVGCTIRTLQSRLQSHIGDKNCGYSAKAKWLRSLKKRPGITPLARTRTKTKASRLEKYWIKKLLRDGADLVNKLHVSSTRPFVRVALSNKLFDKIDSFRRNSKLNLEDAVRSLLESAMENRS